MCAEKVYGGVLCFKYFHTIIHAYSTLYFKAVYVCECACVLHSKSFLFILAARWAPPRVKTMIDGGGAAVGGATGTSSQKFFASHSGGLRDDSV